MKGRIALFTGLAAVAAFAAYALSGIRTSGPMDKAVQLLLLVPASILISIYVSGLLRVDLRAVLKRMVLGPSSTSFCLAAMFVILLFSIWMALVPLEGIPKGGDEVAYFFQSKVFARGSLAAPAPEVYNPRSYFPFRHFIFRNGMWLTMYTPTHAFAMTPFTMLGASWLLGPIEGALILLAVYLLVRTLSSEFYARSSVILLLLSPFYILMIPTHMAHNTNLLFVSWGLLLLARGWKRDSPAMTLVSGLLIGLALTTKPYPIIAWGISITVFLLFRGKKGLKHLLLLFLGSLPAAGYLMAMNVLYTGNPLHTTYELARGGSLVGFGKGSAYYPVYGSFDHTVLKGIRNVAHQFLVGSVAMFGWPGISILPMAAAMALGFGKKAVRWLFLPPAVLAVMLVAHYAPAVAYGPRHYFTMIPVFILLSVIGMDLFIRRVHGRFGTRGSNAFLLSVTGFFCITFLLYLPEEISLRSGPWQAIDTQIYRITEESAEFPALVFMQADEHGFPNICSGILYNSPFLDGKVIFCAHQTPENDQTFIKAFPERNPYLLWYEEDGPRIEEWSFTLASGLLPSDSMRTLPEQGQAIHR